MISENELKVIEKGEIKSTLKSIFWRGDLNNKTIAIFGSFFVMEESRQYLGYQDERDNIFLNDYILKKWIINNENHSKNR